MKLIVFFELLFLIEKKNSKLTQERDTALSESRSHQVYFCDIVCLSHQFLILECLHFIERGTHETSYQVNLKYSFLCSYK